MGPRLGKYQCGLYLELQSFLICWAKSKTLFEVGLDPRWTELSPGFVKVYAVPLQCQRQGMTEVVTANSGPQNSQVWKPRNS